MIKSRRFCIEFAGIINYFLINFAWLSALVNQFFFIFSLLRYRFLSKKKKEKEIRCHGSWLKLNFTRTKDMTPKNERKFKLGPRSCMLFIIQQARNLVIEQLKELSIQEKLSTIGGVQLKKDDGKVKIVAMGLQTIPNCTVKIGTALER